MRNPVKKNMDLLQKPRTFRDRKKNPSKAQQREQLEERLKELHHKSAAPYHRENRGNMRKHIEDEGNEAFDDLYTLIDLPDGWYFLTADGEQHGPHESEYEAHAAAFRSAQHDGV